MKMKLAPVHEVGDTAFAAFYTFRYVFSSEVVCMVHSTCPTKNYKSIYVQKCIYSSTCSMHVLVGVGD